MVGLEITISLSLKTWNEGEDTIDVVYLEGCKNVRQFDMLNGVKEK